MSTMRLERVARLLKEEISAIIHNELKDPRIGFITITRVEVTPDLRQARVHFSILGDSEENKKASAGLKSARSYIRRLIGKRIRLRYIPEISFYFDKSTEYSIHIDETIERLKQKDETGETDS